MKRKFKAFCMILLATIMVSVTSMPIANAASNQLIIVNSKKNTLNFYENNSLVRKFDCATGKKSTPTPQRKTTVVNKIKNRPYYSGGIPGGHPNNPLGKRWMGLNMYGYGTTYGIHGTNNESSIGKNISGGCIRMHNKDVEWLFNKINRGATVIIKSTSNDDAWIAKQYGIKLKLKNNWYSSNGNKYYIKSDGKYATGWYKIGKNTYYFNSKGILQTGWETISGKTYYLGNSGIKSTGLQKIDRKSYYFGSDGVIRTGWQTINGYKYYFNSKSKPSGQAYTSKKVKIGNYYYYFDSNGRMVTNKEIKVGSYYYYFGKDGKMYVNKAGTTYYYGSNGVRSTIKNKIVGDYYLDGKSKIVKKVEKKVVVSGKTYYYYFGSDGLMYKNKSNGNYYYGSDGRRVYNKSIGDYYYGSDGKKVYNKLVNNYYYGKDGKKVIKQFITINNNSYYFGENGDMYKGTKGQPKIVEINGVTYSFDEKGIATEVENEETETPEDPTPEVNIETPKEEEMTLQESM
ncbi:MAG: L,D-transpeptidase family protein [Terrisporobacter sp.]|uniref:L,D-transpeptidase family protein n=1 Tax=Terrisporobacter sp. TaxID=1965305 RepID=UPI002FC59E18